MRVIGCRYWSQKKGDRKITIYVQRWALFKYFVFKYFVFKYFVFKYFVFKFILSIYKSILNTFTIMYLKGVLKYLYL